jgi:leucyl-tRNA synthetase
MGLPYDPQEIEQKWRRRWEAAGLYEPAPASRPNGGEGTDEDVHRAPVEAHRTGDAVFYNLVEFPYPSAEGLHVGNVFKYSGADAYGRYRAMRGRKVFQPIGFDAFGIHTENYALRTGVHPAILTARTEAAFRRQLSRGGFAWDWSKTLDTSEPRYYRWTQWILTRLFDADLMYQAEAPVLWCPSCLTVLAREQTEGERCERCGTPVTERVMRQWFLRTTAYADRLLAGLDTLDWPERAKRLQRRWIGRSGGREIDFGDLTVFTTRPETLPGVTFLAVAPGDPAAGSSRPHPLTGESLPVLEADYIVEGYGTGAVMGVPAHDERDARFAVERKLRFSDAPLLDAVAVAHVGRPAVRFRMRDWLISRQRYWGPPIPIVYCAACGPVAVPESALPVLLPFIEDFRPAGTGVSPLAADPAFVETRCPGCRGPARRETDVSDTFVDSAWYFLRYPSADRDGTAWDLAVTRQPDFYAGGAEHVQRHHLYARFMTMALFDLGLVPFEEPFPRMRLGGLLTSGGSKISKSRGNVVSPDGYVARHGADVLRCALLFACPWEAGGEFRDDSIPGIERFFARLWQRVEAVRSEETRGHDGAPVGDGSDLVADERRAVATVVADVTAAIERLRFNVALARIMEATDGVRSAGALRVLVQLLAPLAPHLAEELWERIGGAFSVHRSAWPVPDPAATDGAPRTIVVQVDGRLRNRLIVAGDASYEDVVQAAMSAAGVQPRRVVYVPGRLVNLVTAPVRAPV